MPALTTTLIAHNEELDLPRALASLAGVADEIILVDSGSTDRTCDIARESGARVYSRKLDSLAEQKNYAASFASNDWILSIDCDEELSPELRSSILAWKQTTPDRNGYEFPRMTNYLGGWIRHSGWYPDYKLKLYRRDRGKFVNVLHEDVKLDGRPDDSKATCCTTRCGRMRSTGPRWTFSPPWARKTCSRADAGAGGPR